MIVLLKKQFLLLILLSGMIAPTATMDSDYPTGTSSLLNWKTGALVVAAGAAGYAYSQKTSGPGESHFPLRENSAAHSDKPKAIVWDLGDVLIYTDKYKLTKEELGLGNLLGYMVSTRRNPFNLHERAHELLNQLGEQTGPEEHKLNAPEGFVLSQLYADMLTGVLTPIEAFARATELVAQLAREGEISSSSEESTLQAMMKLIFDAETLLKYLKANKEGVELVAECAQGPNCKQYILQNWTADSFDELFQSPEGQKVFAYIPRDHCMISGEEKVVKPKPDIFKNLVAKYGLEPQHSVVIDDVLANIEVAKTCGFNTVHFSNMTFAQLRAILIKEGYLKPAV